ncbi:1,2-phenylacetyl-CoA epoxidase subunit PaaD [Nocardioides pacificus]
MTTTIGEDLERAVAAARTVVDPELPMLTLADLGVLRAVEATASGRVVISLAPTWSGCPATDTMRDDLVRVLRAAGFGDVEVRLVLDPPWSTDEISEEGRRRLAEHGVAPPGRASSSASAGGGPVPLVLSAPRRDAACPRCGEARTEALSEFGPTPCTSLRRCTHCLEVFEHMKER